MDNHQQSKLIKQFSLIWQFLGTQTAKFKLLYRASDNNYSVNEFHKKCDNIPNTLVIAQTQYDKVIGGYTPLTWNKDKGSVADFTSKSFIFSVTNQQKYPIINTSKAIYRDPYCGPIFGNDLGISSRCNTSQNGNLAKFPSSYNNGKYIESQNSYQVFSGAINGVGFKIVDWEVFQVQFN